MLVDHRNNNPLINTRGNLRLTTPTGNSQNRKSADKSNLSTGVRGVSHNQKLGKYEAYIHFSNKKHGLGYFESLEEATETVIAAREKYYVST